MYVAKFNKILQTVFIPEIDTKLKDGSSKAKVVRVPPNKEAVGVFAKLDSGLPIPESQPINWKSSLNKCFQVKLISSGSAR